MTISGTTIQLPYKSGTLSNLSNTILPHFHTILDRDRTTILNKPHCLTSASLPQYYHTPATMTRQSTRHSSPHHSTIQRCWLPHEDLPTHGIPPDNPQPNLEHSTSHYNTNHSIITTITSAILILPVHIHQPHHPQLHSHIKTTRQPHNPDHSTHLLHITTSQPPLTTIQTKHHTRVTLPHQDHTTIPYPLYHTNQGYYTSVNICFNDPCVIDKH